VNARGLLEPLGTLPTVPQARAPLAALRERLQAQPPAMLYDGMAALGLSLGQSFQGLQATWVGEGEALGELLLPAGAAVHAADPIHPALLDACTQVAGVILGATAEADGLYLPLQYQELTLFAPVAGHCFCHAWLRDGGPAGAQTRTLDLQLLDEEGRVLGELLGLVVKRAPREALLRSLRPETANWLYRLEWRELPAQEPERAADSMPGTWLVLTDRGGCGAALTAALTARGQRCVPVEAGASFEQRQPNSTSF
jgi:myxalamid-type polyketide synthase MxaB